MCKSKGFTGKQGVIIPHQNVKNLVLKDEVVKAVEEVEEGQFHICSVRTIEEGIELLTNQSADVIFKRVEERLDRMLQNLKRIEKTTEK